MCKERMKERIKDSIRGIIPDNITQLTLEAKFGIFYLIATPIIDTEVFVSCKNSRSYIKGEIVYEKYSTLTLLEVFFGVRRYGKIRAKEIVKELTKEYKNKGINVNAKVDFSEELYTRLKS